MSFPRGLCAVSRSARRAFHGCRRLLASDHQSPALMQTHFAGAPRTTVRSRSQVVSFFVPIGRVPTSAAFADFAPPISGAPPISVIAETTLKTSFQTSFGHIRLFTGDMLDCFSRSVLT
ncbi:hypothetical protein NL676_008924 [Syzygium grande]|nr:hypothetical protein NL676_008924 [Syzygium grande]